MIARDADAAIGNGTDDILHWMLWNIPEGHAARCRKGSRKPTQLPDGTRQISASGPYYRGPGAPAAGPAHHYVFEVYALDSTIDVPAVGQSPPLTRAAVDRRHGGKDPRQGRDGWVVQAVSPKSNRRSAIGDRGRRRIGRIRGRRSRGRWCYSPRPRVVRYCLPCHSSSAALNRVRTGSARRCGWCAVRAPRSAAGTPCRS